MEMILELGLEPSVARWNWMSVCRKYFPPFASQRTQSKEQSEGH